MIVLILLLYSRYDQNSIETKYYNKTQVTFHKPIDMIKKSCKTPSYHIN